LLFYHLLHNPQYLTELVDEIDSKLSPLDDSHPAYSFADAEASLPFMRNCMRENFRITPVFTMPLARRVMAPEGLVISGHHIPQGVSLRLTESQDLR
jgi:cytochrome P450